MFLCTVAACVWRSALSLFLSPSVNWMNLDLHACRLYFFIQRERASRDSRVLLVAPFYFGVVRSC